MSGDGLDAKARDTLKTAGAINEAAFEENIGILRKIGARGFRSMAIFGLGAGALIYAMRRRAASAEAELTKSPSPQEQNPTERYLNEMRGLGFDVDGHEETIAKSKH